MSVSLSLFCLCLLSLSLFLSNIIYGIEGSSLPKCSPSAIEATFPWYHLRKIIHSQVLLKKRNFCYHVITNTFRMKMFHFLQLRSQ